MESRSLVRRVLGKKTAGCLARQGLTESIATEGALSALWAEGTAVHGTLGLAPSSPWLVLS